MSEPLRATAPVVKTDAATLLDVISRAASDPAIDVDKLERLMAMHERVVTRQAEQEFNEAMNAAQTEMRPIATDASNPQTQSRYATFAALDAELRPIYAKHGFSLSFDTGEAPEPATVRVVCHVSHAAGFTRDHHVDMPADGKGAKGGDVMTRTHATGAAMTYGQRYLLKMIFNIAVARDTDGNLGPRDMGEAARRAMEEVNTCEGAAALKAWRDEKSAGLQKILEDHEWRAVVQLWNKRAKEARKA